MKNSYYLILIILLISCKENTSNFQHEKNNLIGVWYVVKYISLSDTLMYYEISGDDKIILKDDNSIDLIFRNEVDTSLKVTYSIVTKGEIELSLSRGNKVDSTFTQNYNFESNRLIFSDKDSLNAKKIELLREKDFLLMKRDIGCKICLIENKSSENDYLLAMSLYRQKNDTIKFNDSLHQALKKNSIGYYEILDTLMKQFNYPDYDDLSKRSLVIKNAENACLEKYPFKMKNSKLRGEFLKKYYFYSLLKSGNNKKLDLLKYIDKEKSSIIFKITGKKDITKETKLMLMICSRNYVVKNCDVEKVKLELLEDSLLMKFSPSFKYWPDSLILNSVILEDV